MGELENVVNKSPDGANLYLFVTPNADVSIFPAGFNKWRKKIEIKVCSKAKDNKANLEVIDIVAKFFNQPIKNVIIISGKKSRDKTVFIKDVSVNKVVKKLKESLNGL
jgi:uncharacterized protein (TIGR00251 family)